MYIAFATKYSGNFKHLKRNIKQLLKKYGVGHVLQTNQLNDQDKQTCLYMEGESLLLHAARKELETHLKSKYPGIVIDEWQEMISDGPINDSHIMPTTGSLSRDSSGFVEDLVENPSNINANDEINESSNWRQHFNSGFIQIVNAILNGRQVMYEIQSSLDSIKEKHIKITYGVHNAVLNIGMCITWTHLLEVITSCKILGIKKPITGIYLSTDNGKKFYIADCSGFQSGGIYHVETETTKLTSMDNIYDKLKSEEELDEDDIKYIKDAFKEQRIKFKQLSATGNLAITDEELAHIGINQLGLRKAILSVIKRYL